MNKLFIGMGGVGALAVLGFGLLIGVAAMAAGATDLGQNSGCSAAALSEAVQASLSATATDDGERFCYPASGYGAAVVQWAKAMADALYVNPACGSHRGGNCNDTWYTGAFPQAVIAYGQSWCHAHGDCTDWANGTYQCVSFVLGAYSQVYPMNVTNDAFALWATYNQLPGWQEIPAAATSVVAERFLPEPGDVMVFKDFSLGHVAIVMAVQPPVGQTDGCVEFANANSSSAYDRMPLLPNLLVDTQEWAQSGEQFVVWGYIRPKPSASQALVRISQLDPGQYADASEYQTWAYSACSAAAMTEVLNAYGKQLRIHDVLTVEVGLHEITPSGGLEEDVGIANTMQAFGFKTAWGEHWALAQVIGIANGGQPVIVGWPPSRYDGGHIVVVTGGDLATGTVRIADSSNWDRTVVSVSQFSQWWAGFAAVSSPA